MGVIFGALSDFSAKTLLFHVLLVFLWTLLLNWLCSSGLAVLSWSLVLFPYVLVGLIFVFVGTDMLYTEIVDEVGEEGFGYSEYTTNQGEEGEEEEEGMSGMFEYQSEEEEEEEEEEEGMRNIKTRPLKMDNPSIR